MAPEALPELPQDEWELTGRLYPESAWMFVWARRVVRDLVGGRVSRFLVGRLEPGSWSVLRGEAEWVAARGANGTASHTASFASAQDAVAYAAAGLAVDENIATHEDLLREQGIVGDIWDDARKRLEWQLTDDGRRLVEKSLDEGRARYGDSGIVLDQVLEHRKGYQVIRPVPRPDGGLFIGRHEFFMAHVHSRLPGDFGASTGEELPENTLLDSYAPADEPYLFTLETPFERRGLSGTGRNNERRFYVVKRPITVYPGFPVKETTIPPQGLQRVKEPSSKGQGYLLPRPLADLVAAGDIIQVTKAEALRIYRGRT
ncbi:TNT domain-containing protein [Actinomadura madurae]|uniref:DUF4237 domain-containing protein n=1 Tax=Actinomadura madurae TaxID=1993 RepID=A0A1I5GAA2_9ACTN|nr:hypothetical protein [Actinomadura madurae]SFO32819.1 hypothetical protein SAMN04489713_105104 [Actinomadura madurae]SPT51065.1 Uncharacterised protein [Actinomadura madurae]